MKKLLVLLVIVLAAFFLLQISVQANAQAEKPASLERVEIFDSAMCNSLYNSSRRIDLQTQVNNWLTKNAGKIIVVARLQSSQQDTTIVSIFYVEK